MDVIKTQTYKSTTEHDIKQQMGEFLVNATHKIDHLSKNLKELKSLSNKMADFFCQDVASFKLEECFQIFYKFSEQFKQAIKNNEKRQQLERQAVIRQKLKDQELAEKVLDGKCVFQKMNLTNNSILVRFKGLQFFFITFRFLVSFTSQTFVFVKRLY